MRKLGRRGALKPGGGTAAGLGATHLLGACGGEGSVAQPPPAPSSSEDAGLTICHGTVVEANAQVAAVRRFDLYAMTREVLDLLGGLETVVGEGESVFIKPNMATLPGADDTRDPFGEGECTKAEILIAVAEECLRVGASEVVIGDGSQMPSFGWSRAGERPPRSPSGAHRACAAGRSFRPGPRPPARAFGCRG
jgi:hypothetical protein